MKVASGLEMSAGRLTKATAANAQVASTAPEATSSKSRSAPFDARQMPAIRFIC